MDRSNKIVFGLMAFLGTLGALFVISIVVSIFYFTGISENEVYDELYRFIPESDKVEQCVGKVESIGDWLPHSRKIVNAGASGKAFINIYVKGDKMGRVIFFRLVKEDGRWKVTEVKCLD